jgi:hypothetical protein
MQTLTKWPHSLGRLRGGIGIAANLECSNSGRVCDILRFIVIIWRKSTGRNKC